MTAVGIRLMVLLCAFGFFAGFAHTAQAKEGTENTISASEDFSERVPSKKGFAIGLQSGYSTFKYSNNGVNVQSTGLLTGVAASYDFLLDYSLLRFEGDFLSGQQKWSATSQTNGSYNENLKGFVSNLRGTWVRPYYLSLTTVANYYGGIGYRKNTSKFEKSGEMNSSIAYLPVGASLKTEMGQGWSLEGSVEYEILLSASTVNSDRSTTKTFKQQSGNGIRVAGTVRKDFGQHAVKVQPYWNYWKIAKSERVFDGQDAQYIYYSAIPENTTSVIGLNVGVDL